jgi:hypothetical protein
MTSKASGGRQPPVPANRGLTPPARRSYSWTTPEYRGEGRRIPAARLTAAVPDIAPYLDWERIEWQDRSFLMEDWRNRESDLLFRIPFRSPAAETPVLVCILLEHQSAPDPRMPPPAPLQLEPLPDEDWFFATLRQAIAGNRQREDEAGRQLPVP